MIVSKSGKNRLSTLRVSVLGSVIAAATWMAAPSPNAAALPLVDKLPSTIDSLTDTVDNVVDKTVSPLTEPLGNTLERTVPSLTAPVVNTLDQTLGDTVPSLVNPLLDTTEQVLPGVADPVRSTVNETVPALTNRVTQPIGNLVQTPGLQPPLNTPNTQNPAEQATNNRSGRGDAARRQDSANAANASRPSAQQTADNEEQKPKNPIEKAIESLSALYSKFLEGARSIRLHPAALALGLVAAITAIGGTVFYSARHGKNWASSGAGVMIGNKLHINANILRYAMFGMSIAGLAFLGFVLASL